jgi:ornithine cyclodeaminase/alanine dehydrogenase-like protein (mu-crystallin family)
MTLILNNEEVRQALDAGGYVDAMEEAFRELGKEAAINSPRTETCVPLSRYGTQLRSEVRRLIDKLPVAADPYHSDKAIRAGKKSKEAVYRFKTMPGGYPGCGIMALRIDSTLDTYPSLNGRERQVKLPLATGWRYTGIVILFSLKTGEVLGILPDGEIQKMRVGATSAVGVKYLSRKDSKILGLLGTGWQAEAQLETVVEVRSLKQIRVFSPDPRHRADFAARMESKIGIEILPVESAAEVFKNADIVLTATTSSGPVFRAAWLEPGMHLGTVNPQEADSAAFRKCYPVVVNIRPFGGPDLVQNFVLGGNRPTSSGKIMNTRAHRIDWTKTIELGDFLTATRKFRRSRSDITFHCNNVGLGMQFAAAGRKILDGARKKRLGHEVPTDWFLQKEHT